MPFKMTDKQEDRAWSTDEVWMRSVGYFCEFLADKEKKVLENAKQSVGFADYIAKQYAERFIKESEAENE